MENSSNYAIIQAFGNFTGRTDYPEAAFRGRFPPEEVGSHCEGQPLGVCQFQHFRESGRKPRIRRGRRGNSRVGRIMNRKESAAKASRPHPWKVQVSPISSRQERTAGARSGKDVIMAVEYENVGWHEC